MPMALTLIEAIAGRDKAQAVGRDLGLMSWDARHASDAFSFTRPFALTAIGNTLAFWTHEQLGIEIAPGLDEVSLALVADAWSRTYRSRAVTFAGTGAAQLSRKGIRIVPDRVTASWPAKQLLPPIESPKRKGIGRNTSRYCRPLRRPRSTVPSFTDRSRRRWCCRH
jgi:hypothetical protein